jgi:hypothetical protein
MNKTSKCQTVTYNTTALHSSTVTEASLPAFAFLRAAMAFNNMGVSLLERNCYTQAGATFKEAVALLRSSGCNNSINPKGCCTHGARLRLAQPQPDASASTLIALPLLETISNTMTCLDLHSILAAEDPRPTLRAVRLEDCHDDPELISAMVMHNFGLSYLLLARTMALRGDDRNASKYRHGAAKLARIAHSIVAKSSQEECQTGTNESAMLCLVVLQTLVHTVTFAQTAQAARPYASLLQQWTWTWKSFSPGLALQQQQSLAPAA